MAKRKSAKKETPDKKEKPDFEKKKKVQMLNPVAKRVYAKPIKEEERKNEVEDCQTVALSFRRGKLVISWLLWLFPVVLLSTRLVHAHTHANKETTIISYLMSSSTRPQPNSSHSLHDGITSAQICITVGYIVIFTFECLSSRIFARSLDFSDAMKVI